MTGSSSFLPVSVRGIAGSGDDRVRDVPRRERVAERAGDPRPQRVVELEPVAQDDEEKQLVRLLEVDDEAVEHLVELLDAPT